jgi:hypothetical protein
LSDLSFIVEPPVVDGTTIRLPYRLGALRFTEVLTLPAVEPAAGPAWDKLLGLTALVLGVSYFKLLAPFHIASPIALTATERAFILDVYENGLGEFYARNDLRRFGRLTIEAPEDTGPPPAAPALSQRVLLPIGGGKDSLVSVQLLAAAGVPFTPFAVNPKGPILGSVETIGLPPLYVTRTLDPEMIRLGKEPGYYNGHVPSTAINSMIAALVCLASSYDRIVLSNERSASEGNVAFDGREANHQHSKSLDFERMIAGVLGGATGGALGYFSLLRPYSEARIARLFARETRFDRVFSSCNRNFTQKPHEGLLWCGECPKCHFVFLILACAMDKDRLIGIFGQNVLANPANETSFRNLTGLAGQKPWECVGEILEAAACLQVLANRPEWQDDAIVVALRAGLLAQYGAARLDSAYEDLMTDSGDHLIPTALAQEIARHAV